MISAIENQPIGADLISQVEEIFSPTGFCRKAKNFEFRPQQQEMAVAVARALQIAGISPSKPARASANRSRI
jgi:ATP-dependent DNA helicase DinG